jgi:hypothetical protein
VRLLTSCIFAQRHRYKHDTEPHIIDPDNNRMNRIGNKRRCLPVMQALGGAKGYKGMKKILTILIFVSLLFVVVPLTSFSQSQKPTPRPLITGKQEDEKATNSNQKTKQNPRGTEEKPFIIKILPTVKSKAEADYETRERYEKSTNEWWLMCSAVWLAIVTTFLAVFTGFLWWFTLKLWKTTHAAFIATNRPRLRIRGVFSDSGILPNRIYIANVGGSNATNIIVHAVFTRKEGNVREAPWIENLSKSIWHGPKKLAPGEQGMYELRSKPDIAVDSQCDMSDIITRRKILLIVGEARYRDANDTERKTNFGWIYDLSVGEFSKPEKEDQYNYED